MLLIFSQKENNLGIWKHVYFLVFGYFYLKKNNKFIQKCMFQTRYKKNKARQVTKIYILHDFDFVFVPSQGLDF